MNEFSVIRNFFSKSQYVRKDVILGIGDDAAVTRVPAGQLLVTTTDTLLEGVHFLPDTDPSAVAHKSIATNLSDLSAMGAEPSWINLSLSIPSADDIWLESFSSKVHELCEYYSIQLIGGDTVKGGLSVTITAQGFVPPDSYLGRDGANKGDWIFVTGTLGDAAAGLAILNNQIECATNTDRLYLTERHLYPSPRVLAGTALRRLASSCLDVSDGLLQDMRHVLEASDVGAVINLDDLPVSKALGETVSELESALEYACYGGDDYELLFTVPEEHRVSVESAMSSYNIQCTCIGQITGANKKLELRLKDESYQFENELTGYKHF
ncbi:MAG: thiamine-phosphate kinase [Pseudomonadota bacterium]